MDHETAKKRILLSATLALVVLLCTFAFGIRHLHSSLIRNEAVNRLDSVTPRFQAEFENDAAVLSAAIDVLQQNEPLRAAWRTLDRDALLAETVSLLDTLRANHRITHLSFHTVDHKNFLRVHQPDTYGDVVDRVTLSSAARTGESAYGLEFGLLDTLMLRVVQPWQLDGRLAGYIEMATPIGDVPARIGRSLGVDIVLLVKKKFIIQENWEQGLDMLGLAGDWDQFRQSVVVAGTIDQVPGEIAQRLNSSQPSTAPGPIEIDVSSRRYLADLIDLKDAGARPVAELVVLCDIVSLKPFATSSAVTLVGASFIVAAGLFFFLYLTVERAGRQYADSTSRDIAESHARETDLREQTDKIQRLKEKLELQMSSLRASVETLRAQLDRSRKAETAAQSLTAQIERVLGLTMTSIAFIDSEYCISYVDPATRHRSGNPGDAKCYQYFTRSDTPCPECRVADTIRTRKSAVTEQVLPKENDRPVQLATVPFQNKDGEWLAAEFRIDITERKRAEQEMLDREKSLRESLAEREEALKAILNSTADGILAVNEKGRTTHSSARFAEMWHVPKELIETRDSEKILDYILEQLDEPEAFLSQLRDLFRKPKSSPGSQIETISFTDGRVFERASSPMMKENRIAGRVWSFRDVTEQKRAEQERLVKERLEGVVEMAGAACHELNQPLQAISGYVELMTMRLDPEHPSYEYLQTIREQLSNMTATTRKLQNIVRYETQEYTAGTKIIDIDKATDSTTTIG